MLAQIVFLALAATAFARPQESVISPDGHEMIWYDKCPPSEVHFLLPHEYDCTKFYYCEYGYRRVDATDCAPGTEFSFDLQVCVHPDQAQCNLTGFPEEDGTTEVTEKPTHAPPPTTESTTTAAPASTEASVISTTTAAPSSTEASVISTTTAAPSSTEASVISTTTAAPSSTEASVISTTTAAPSSTEASVISTTTAAPSSTEASVISTTTAAPSSTEASVISTTTAAPSSTEASVISTTTAAPASTEASVISTSSARPASTEAGIVSSPHPIPTSSPAPEATEEPINEVTAPEGTEWQDNGCPADWHIHWLLPHESDCSKFYYCNFGEKVVRDCAPGTVFNPALQVCDHPWNFYYCVFGEKQVRNCPAGLHFNPVIQVCDWPENDGSNGGWLDNGCPADWNVHWLLPHESNCGKFYYCVFGEKQVRNCPGDLHFNPVLQVCDWPENAVELLDNGCPADFDVHWLLPHESDCAKFYYCVFGEKVERECSAPLHFNPVIQVCDWPENAEQQPDHSKCEDGCNVVPWAHESACDKYWRCDGNKATLVICSEGLHFNAHSGTCDFICNANCLRANVQTTADQQGLKIFLPWEKVSKGMPVSLKEALRAPHIPTPAPEGGYTYLSAPHIPTPAPEGGYTYLSAPHIPTPAPEGGYTHLSAPHIPTPAPEGGYTHLTAPHIPTPAPEGGYTYLTAPHIPTPAPEGGYTHLSAPHIPTPAPEGGYTHLSAPHIPTPAPEGGYTYLTAPHIPTPAPQGGYTYLSAPHTFADPALDK
ncbi:chitin binding peritrophin-A domain-containing protein [Phthorimaea operculella]|nr:chitin binding peritrophin-A domain-containing protein [Phthorimaea operculella]